MDTNINSEKSRASILRQLAASFYDGLLLIGILLIAAALTIPFTQAGIIKTNNPILSLYYITVCFAFFAGFWVRGGKTLGMHVWHIQIEQFDGNKITLKQALIRFSSGLPAWGILVLSLIRYSVPEKNQANYFSDWLMTINPAWLFVIACTWLVIDHKPDSWRDRISGTQIIYKK